MANKKGAVSNKITRTVQKKNAEMWDAPVGGKREGKCEEGAGHGAASRGVTREDKPIQNPQEMPGGAGGEEERALTKRSKTGGDLEPCLHEKSRGSKKEKRN